VRAARPTAAPPLESTPFRSFLELSPPRRGPDAVGFDVAVEQDRVRLRGYAWGPRAASWDRLGRWQLFVADRFAIRGGAWLTAVSRGRWRDAIEAAGDFGHESGGAPAVWRAELEPSGRAGALRINVRGRSELHLFEEERGIVHVPEAGKMGLAALAGVVKLGSGWYVGSQSGGELKVLAIEGDRLVKVFDFPSRAGERTSTRAVKVVRNVRGDSLGIWIVATGWYVMPVDRDTGAVGEPLYVPPQALAAMPKACASEGDGYILEGEPPIPPYVEFSRGAEPLRVRGVEARIVASSLGLCTAELAGLVEGATPKTLAGAADRTSSVASVPMTLTDAGAGGRRRGFRCLR
jgi:hypothetical protein